MEEVYLIPRIWLDSRIVSRNGYWRSMSNAPYKYHVGSWENLLCSVNGIYLTPTYELAFKHETALWTGQAYSVCSLSPGIATTGDVLKVIGCEPVEKARKGRKS